MDKMMSKYMGQIMAECDCQHQACEMRGYCMTARIEELEAKLAAKEKLMLALAGDKIDLVSELAGVKAKLAKAVEELEEYKWMYEDLCK